MMMIISIVECCCGHCWVHLRHSKRIWDYLLIDMWNTCTESMCLLLFRKDLAMSPIVITDALLLWASQRGCVVPLSMPRHARHTVMQFLPSLPSIVYGGGVSRCRPKRAPDVFRHIDDWTRQSVNPVFSRNTLDRPCILHYYHKWGTENTFSGSRARLFHSWSKVKLIKPVKGQSLCEMGRNWQWNRQCDRNWLCCLSIKVSVCLILVSYEKYWLFPHLYVQLPYI